MDAPEKDRDVALQKAGSGWLADFREQIPRFLYSGKLQDSSPRPREYVRLSTTAELVNLASRIFEAINIHVF